MRAWDPVAIPEARKLLTGVEFCERSSRRVADADAAVIVTEWDELRDLADAGDPRRDAEPAHRRRPQPARPRDGARGRASPTRGSAAPSSSLPRAAPRPTRARAETLQVLMEALVLAGGKARAARARPRRGLPKPLVPVGGRPLASYAVERLAAAGVTRVIVACAAGQEARLRRRARRPRARDRRRSGEPEPLGRGGGLRLAAQALVQSGPGVRAERRRDRSTSTSRALLAQPRRARARRRRSSSRALRSPFGVVELDEDDAVTRLRGGAAAPALGERGDLRPRRGGARRALPERGDHEQTTFPELAARGRLMAYRHEGVWLTVNTPKDLRVAEEALA